MSACSLLICVLLLVYVVGCDSDRGQPIQVEPIVLVHESSRDYYALMSVISVDIFALNVFSRCFDLIKANPEKATKRRTKLIKESEKQQADRSRKCNMSERILCEVAGCDLPATFSRSIGNSQELVACRKHRRSNDMDSRHKLCQQPGCSIQASYGDIFQNIPIFCSAHKNASHVHLYGKHCTHQSCVRWASYADSKGLEPTHCARHRHSHQVDVRNRKCSFENFSCCKQPSFGLPHTGTAVHCAQHRQVGEVDLKNMQYRCQHPFGCRTFALSSSSLTRCDREKSILRRSFHRRNLIL